jgi:hypothetical protein
VNLVGRGTITAPLMARQTETQPRTFAPDPRDERRSQPRIPTELGVLVEWSGRRVMGVTTDSSEEGLGVALRGAGPEVGHEVSVRLNLPDAGWHELGGTVAHAAPNGDGTLLGVRLTPGAIAPSSPSGPPTTRDGRGRRPRVRGSRAKPKRREARPLHEILAELRALGGYVYEQAILGEDSTPAEATNAWVAELAGELGAKVPEPASDYPTLMRQLAELHRFANQPGE